MEFAHVPVLLNEAVEGLNVKEDGIYVDCTMGGAGHSSLILKELNNTGLLIGIDQDIEALNASREKLKKYDNVKYVHDNFSNIKAILKSLDIEKVDGIIMDLGISSYQIDEPSRGFSYMHDAPLDMRMNRDNRLSAYTVINEYSEKELTRVIKDFGEERFANRISKFIVERRKKIPVKTTFELVDIIREAIPMKFQKDGHPAKKTFQAVRIEVNRELDILKGSITDSVDCLRKDGRISVITFQSLEDRIVKHTFKKLEDPCTCPKDLPFCVCGRKPLVSIITKKPIEPGEEELKNNKRSRSAKLRVAQRTEF